MILGLPGEAEEQFRATARALGGLPVSGIKIHNLHVIRGSDLEREFREKPFPVYDEEAYAAILIDFLRRLPPTLPIIRINTDTVEANLIAPRWRMTKGQFRTYVEQEMARQQARQGDLYGSEP